MDMRPTAQKICVALEKKGTDDQTLIRELAKLDPLQIAGLRKVYTSRITGDLEKDIHLKTSGDYRDSLQAIVQGPLLHDAYCIKRAIKGAGTNERMLNDALIGRSNADLRAIKAAYQQTFGKDMEAEVRDDLSMKTKDHFKKIMSATRNEESTPVYPQQTEQDVNALRGATEGRLGTDELLVCGMMTQRSDGQIRAIAQQYQQRFQTGLDTVIRKEFSGHMEEALLLQLARATDRAMSDAVQLEEAMKGAGTKDELLIQRVVRLHWDRQHLDQVKRAYAHRFKTPADGLVKRVRGETSGDYKRLLVACLE
jgi:annexin A7/11